IIARWRSRQQRNKWVYLTQTRLHGRLALRIAVGNVLTTERHLAQAWELICHHLAIIKSASNSNMPE
ncbi:MAG: hypothetical protein WKF30_12115, partial [Pyrinomonadaceae bacterium]